MKKLFRAIFYIPKLLLHFLWHFFWGLFKLALVLAIVGFGLFYYANHSTSPLANNISQAFRQVELGFSGTSSADLENAISKLSTDTITESNGARWGRSSATVYIETTDPTLVAAYQQAIADWNATGAFTFDLTDDTVNANIIATEYSDGNSQAAGLADTQTNVLTNRITHVDVRLNTYYLLDNRYGYDYQRIVNTAAHELGHAIGLDHDDSESSVMQSAGSYYGIQQTDIDTVNSLYAN